MPKNIKGDPLGVFEHPLSKIEKMKGGPFGDMRKKLRKKSHKAEKNLHKKFWSRTRLEPMSFCLADLKKAVTSLPSAIEVVWHSLVLVPVNL